MTPPIPRLQDFLVANRGEILARSRATLGGLETPAPAQSEVPDRVPPFLDQLVEVLRAKDHHLGDEDAKVAAGATMRGAEMFRMGLTVAQVVQQYGSICQGVTAVAAERGVTIAVEDFHTFNACLDLAIAHAVTGYEYQRDRSADSSGLVQLGFLAHEMRNLLTRAVLAFGAVGRSDVGRRRNYSDILGGSLRQMRSLIDRTLAEVRVEANLQAAEHISLPELMEEMEIVASSEAKGRQIELSVDPGPVDLAVVADRQIVTSVVVNLVQNALKFTRVRGRIKIRAYEASDRVRIDVEDECGGLPPGATENLFQPFKQQGGDRTGLGLGLALSIKGARTCGGDIRIRDLPGVGCVFTVDLPRAQARL